MDFSPQLLTVAQAARALGQSRETIRRKIRVGQLDAFRVGGERGPLRITETALLLHLHREQRAGVGSAVPAPAPVSTPNGSHHHRFEEHP